MKSTLNVPGGRPVFFRHWPAEKSKAVLCIVHGLGEHSGRYENYARFLNRKGISCLAIDLPGHGQTTGSRGHFSSLDEIFRCVNVLLDEAKSLHPGIPVFLLGQSMGGNVVLNYTLQNPGSVAGVIAQSSWIRLHENPSKSLLRFAKLMRGICPGFAQSNGLNPLDLATSPEVAKAYKADPLVHDRISVAAGLTMLEAARNLEAFSGMFPVPLLLMHGTADRITDFHGSSELAERCTGDVHLELYNGFYHELHNEPIAKTVMNKVADWMLERGTRDEGRGMRNEG